MSTQAQKNVQRLWSNLVFAIVATTTARDPQDILRVDVYKSSGTYPNGTPKLTGLDLSAQYRGLTSMNQLPPSDRLRAEVDWRQYSGVTTNGIAFKSGDYRELDMDIDLTLQFGDRYANHAFGKSRRPLDGQLICGEVVTSSAGPRFTRWFACDDAFHRLVERIRGIRSESEDRLAPLLLTDDFPDKYWAIARLILFDNVDAFVNECRWSAMKDHWSGPAPDWIKHPAAGKVYGSRGLTCGPNGMSLPLPPDDYVDRISSALHEPSWIRQFQQRCSELNIARVPVAPSGSARTITPQWQCILPSVASGSFAKLGRNSRTRVSSRRLRSK